MEDLIFIYSQTEDGSLLRRLALDIVSSTGVFNGYNAKELEEADRQIPLDALVAFAFVQKQEKKSKDLDVEVLCKRCHLHPASEFHAEADAAVEEEVEVESSDEDGDRRQCWTRKPQAEGKSSF